MNNILTEAELKKRVNQFWSVLNKTLVEKWLNVFQNRKLFGDQEPDLAILEKIKHYYYSDAFPKRSFVYKCERYNENSEYNKENGLPEQIVELIELEPYLPKLKELFFKLVDKGIERTEAENTICDNFGEILKLFANEYAGEMIDFSSDYTKEYFYETINHPENNELRQQAIKFIETDDSLDNYFLCLPETYDLILKGREPNRGPPGGFDPKYLKYGLFLAYLDEFYLREKTTRQSRYIFTPEDIKNWFLLIPNDYKNAVRDYFFAFPFIAPRKNWVHSYRNKFLTKENIDHTWEPDLVRHAEFRYNINGSEALGGLFPEIGANDIDIRIDYKNREGPMSDTDFDRAVKYFAERKNIKVEKIMIKGGNYKYRGDGYDIYRASFGFISNYHVPAVRINYDDNGFLFYPSAVIALLTGYCVDIRYFTTENQDPMKVIEKYVKRGFSFMLNENEMALYLEFIAKTKSEAIHGYVPLVLRTDGYDEYVRQIGEDEVPLADVEPRFKLNGLRQLMYTWHNDMIGTRKRIIQTKENLPVPF